MQVCHKQYILTFRQWQWTKVCARKVSNHKRTTTKSDIILALVISNSRFHCLSSRAIQILIHSGSLQIGPGGKKWRTINGSRQSNKRCTTKTLFKHYYWFIIDPVWKRNQVGSVSTFGCASISCLFFFFLFFTSFLNTHNWGLIFSYLQL